MQVAVSGTGAGAGAGAGPFQTQLAAAVRAAVDVVQAAARREVAATREALEATLTQLRDARDEAREAASGWGIPLPWSLYYCNTSRASSDILRSRHLKPIEPFFFYAFPSPPTLIFLLRSCLVYTRTA